MSINSVLAAVASMNNDEVQQVYEALRARRDVLARQTTRTLSAGDKVTFDRGTRGGPVTGEVLKVNRKTALVYAEGVRWKVAASLLQVA